MHDSQLKFDGFILIPAERTLLRDGCPVELNARTFDLLVYLATHPQQTLSKDELLSSVWPDAIVEESNLSQHIFLLRKMLASTGSSSKLIATLPGRGYQFVPQVVREPHHPSAMKQADAPQSLVYRSVESVTSIVVEEETEEIVLAPKTLPNYRSRRWPWMLAGVAATLLLITGGFLYWRHTRPPKPPILVVMADFQNATGDPALDHVMDRAIQISLEKSPSLNLLPRSKIDQTLAEMVRKPEEPLTAAVGREICQRNSGQAMLHGILSRLGSSYVVQMEAEGCATGRQLALYQATVSRDELLDRLNTAADRIRSQLGKSQASSERYTIPLEHVTTYSLEALRAYSEARASLDHGDARTAGPLLEHAIALDANFTSAYRALGVIYYNRQDFVQASAYYKRAFDLRDRVTGRERLNIEISYYNGGIRDLESAAREMLLFDQMYPGSSANWVNLCNTYTQLGWYPQAVEAGQKALRLGPNNGLASIVLARALVRANRLDEARQVAQQAIAGGREQVTTHGILFQIAFVESDTSAMKTEGEYGLTHGVPLSSLGMLAGAAAAGGRLHKAQDDLERAHEEALRTGDSDMADSYLLNLAVIQAELGQPSQAAAALGRMHGDAGYPGDVARLRVDLGDLAPAQRVLSLNTDFTRYSTIHNHVEIPLLRATLALHDHKPADAVRLLEPARPYQMRDFEVPWLRAQAEAEAGMLDAAAGDYRLILDNPGVDPTAPEYSLAHLRLARVLALEKKIEAARAEYQRFFSAWKDADADLPLLRAARAEFSKLPAK